MTPIGDELKKGHEYWKRVDVRWIDRAEQDILYNPTIRSSIKPKENQPTELPGHFQIGLQVTQPHPSIHNE